MCEQSANGDYDVNKTLWWLHLASLLCAVAGVEAQIYKWVDGRGQTFFGDVPPPGVRVQPYPVMPPPPPDPLAEQRRHQMRELVEQWHNQRLMISARGYENVEIVEPKSGGYVKEQGEGIVVTASLTPPLRTDAGHLIQVMVDGRPIGEPSADATRHLHGVERGRHSVAVRILAADGSTIAQSAPVSFQYQRESRHHASPFFAGPEVPGSSPLLPPAGPARAAPNMQAPVHNPDLRTGPVSGPFRSSGPPVYQAPRPTTAQPTRATTSSAPPPPPGGGAR